MQNELLKQLELQEMASGENALLPAVEEFYCQKASDWKKEGLSPNKQGTTLCQINRVLRIIDGNIKVSRTSVKAQNLEHVLEQELKNCETSQEKVRVLGAVEYLLRQGDEALKKIAWWYGAYPEVYEEKFALNKSALKLDKLHNLFKKHPTPYYSFIAFSKGENPVFAWNPEVWQKVLETQNFAKPGDENAYNQWLTTDAGQKYAQEKTKYHKALNHLLLQAQDCLGLEERARKKQGR